MIKFILSIGLIICGLLLGQVLKKMVENKTIQESVPVGKYMLFVQRIALLVINPVVTLGAFWGSQFNDMKLIALPILGAAAISLGGALAYTASKFLKHDKKKLGLCL